MQFTLFAQFTLLIMLGASVVAAGITATARHYGVEAALAREGSAVLDQVHALVDPALSSDDLRFPTSERQRSIEQILRERVVFGRTLRASILSLEGTVLYSTDPSFVGMRRDALEQLTAVQSHQVRTLFSDEPGVPGGFVIYAPVRIGGQVAGAYEIHRRPDPLDPNLGDRWLAPWLGTAAGVSLLFLLMLPLVRRISQLLAKRAEENARLIEELEVSYADLRRALDEASGVRERLTLLAAAVEGSAETILISDTSGRILYANPAAQDIFGYEPSELTGKNVRMFQPPRLPPLAEEILRASAEGVWQGQVKVLCKDGREIPVRVTASMVRDEGGSASGIVALIHDLSEEQRHQEELIQARSQAAAYQRGESLKSELISIVSHELRTPLTALQGFSELLLVREPSDEERRLWTTTINEETKRLAEILDDLLNVSRIDAGAIRLNIAPTAIEDVIREVFTSFSTQSPRHDFVLGVETSGLAVAADRDRLTQILDNLLSNAVKYSPGGGTIRIEVRERAGDAVVSVTDQGLGIPVGELPKLFSRFHRIDSHDRISIRGTGLGLYITQQLVAMHGGRVSVNSEVGRGSTFTFTLPLVPADTKAMTGAR